VTKGVAKEKTSGFPLVCEGGCNVQAEARLNIGPIGKGSPIGVRRAKLRPMFPWYSASSLSATIPIGPTPSAIALKPPNAPWTPAWTKM